MTGDRTKFWNTEKSAVTDLTDTRRPNILQVVKRTGNQAVLHSLLRCYGEVARARENRVKVSLRSEISRFLYSVPLTRDTKPVESTFEDVGTR